MKSAVKILCIIGLVYSGILFVTYFVLGIVTAGAYFASAVVTAVGIYFETMELSELRKGKPRIWISVCLIIFGNVFGLAAGIVALCMKKDSYVDGEEKRTVTDKDSADAGLHGYDPAKFGNGETAVGTGTESGEEEIFEDIASTPMRHDGRSHVVAGESSADGKGSVRPLPSLPEELEKAAEEGNPVAQHEAGEYLFAMDDEYAKIAAARWWKKSAQAGYAPAETRLGLLSIEGKWVRKNGKEGARLLSAAAEQGDERAMDGLGLFRLSARGEDRNPAEAVRLFRAAADKGYKKAKNNLGYCLAKGIGTDKDRDEAARLFREAAEDGCADAQYNMGLCYDNGAGVERDRKAATLWYRAAAGQGHQKAMDALAKRGGL